MDRPLHNWRSYHQELTQLIDNNVDADAPMTRDNPHHEKQQDPHHQFQFANRRQDTVKRPEPTPAPEPDFAPDPEPVNYMRGVDDLNRMRAQTFRDQFKKDVAMATPDRHFFN